MSRPTRCPTRCGGCFATAAWSGGAFAWRTSCSAARSSKWRPSAPPRAPVAQRGAGAARPIRRRGRGAGARSRMPRASTRGEGSNPSALGIDHERVLDTHGRLLRDNVYGSIEEDVWRRDFTANALYYNIADFSLWDFVGGGRGHRGAPPALDRRSGDALSRGSGAHAARGALRGQARLRRSSAATAAPIARAAQTAGRRAGGALVR